MIKLGSTSFNYDRLSKYAKDEEILCIIKNFFEAGKAKEKGITEEDVDKEELLKGIKVEMEHTNSETIAKKIALDHLAEISDYYTRLAKMESEAGE
jgi:hypothetical protein